MKIKNVILLLCISVVAACTNYKHLANALAPGMTKQEVVKVMGNPHYKRIDGKREQYCYQKECRFEGGVTVYFDEHRLLESTR